MKIFSFLCITEIQKLKDQFDVNAKLGLWKKTVYTQYVVFIKRLRRKIITLSYNRYDTILGFKK